MTGKIYNEHHNYHENYTINPYMDSQERMILSQCNTPNVIISNECVTDDKVMNIRI